MLIRTEDRAQRLIDLIVNANEIGENCVIEFKAVPHSMDFECEFYKDILALLNSYDRPTEDRWLIYGVANKAFTPIGFDAGHGGLLDDSRYQEKFLRISPRPHIELVVIDGERILGEKGANKKFAAFYIPSETTGFVYELNTAVTDRLLKPAKSHHMTYNVGASFVRYGSSTKFLREEDRVRIRAIGANKRSAPATPFELVASIPNGKVPAAATLTDSVDNLRLLGSWDERNERDRQAIAEMCGKPYEQIIPMLKDDLDNGLFTVQKSTWTAQNRLTMIKSVASHLTGASLEAHAVHFGNIVSSVDEMYAMPESQRVMVNAIGANRGCSKTARKGAASLCAILANNPRLVPNCTKQSIDAFVSMVMAPVFATDDWHIPASADDVLPLLAQASPAIYLMQIGRSLQNHATLADFLAQKAGGFDSIKLGWGLLRGIIIAAMKADQMARAISVLVQLLPYSDMAKDIIVTILLPWLPQTEATASSRKGMGTFPAKQGDPKAW